MRYSGEKCSKQTNKNVENHHLKLNKIAVKSNKKFESKQFNAIERICKQSIYVVNLILVQYFPISIFFISNFKIIINL